jgi:hypothetical protein
MNTCWLITYSFTTDGKELGHSTIAVGVRPIVWLDKKNTNLMHDNQRFYRERRDACAILFAMEITLEEYNAWGGPKDE